MFSKARMAREEKTINALVGMYCRHHHNGQAIPCPECAELRDYALHRLSKCPYQEQKPTCAKCPIHCYKPEMRARIAKVMRFSGPRLLRSHPILAIVHLLDARKPVPKLPGK